MTADDLTAQAAVPPERPGLWQRAKWFGALAVTVGIFVVLLLKIDVRSVADALRGARFMPLLAAAALSIIIKVFVGADKWRRILAALSCHVSLSTATFIRTANGPLRTISPAKSGTLLAAVYLQRYHGLAFAKGVSSLLLERLQNLVVLVVFVVLGPPLFRVTAPAQVNRLFSGRALLVSGCALAMLAVLYAFRRPLYALVARVNVKVANAIRDLASCFREIRPGRQAGLLLYAAAGQVGEIAMAYLIFRAVGVSVPFGTVFVGLALVVIISNVPITVAGLGTREAALVILFASYGTEPKLLTVGILISAIGYMLPVIAGMPILGPFVRRLTASSPTA